MRTFLTPLMTEIDQIQQEDYVSILSHSPDGKSLLIGLHNKPIKVINATLFTKKKQIKVGHLVNDISLSLTQNMF